jgi:hypothetical protein
MNLTYFLGSRRNVLRAMLGVLGLGAFPIQAAEPPPPPPIRILILGDSQAQGLAGGFVRLYLRQPNIRVLDRSKIGTGLSHPNFDWPAQARKLADTEHADIAIVMFGANDRPTIRLHNDDTITQSRVAAFTKSYGEKVSQVVQALKTHDKPVIWVGHPQVRDANYNYDMALLNGIFADKAARAGAMFIPLWKVFTGADGNYNAYGPGIDGQTTRLRADDGVHLSRDGYDVLARYLVKQTHGALSPDPGG